MSYRVNPVTDIKIAMFDFITETLPVRCDDRQRKMGLSYVTLPTRTIICEITSFSLASGYVLNETDDFIRDLTDALHHYYVQRTGADGYLYMTAEVGDLANIISCQVARQLA